MRQIALLSVAPESWTVDRLAELETMTDHMRVTLAEPAGRVQLH